MNQEYHEIYKDLYEIYRTEFSSSMVSAYWTWLPDIKDYNFNNISRADNTVRSYLRALRLISEAIEESISELRLFSRLRPDAKHFLLINLHQMVILPMLSGHYIKTSNNKISSFGRDDFTPIGLEELNLKELVKNDVYRILSEARENHPSNEDISGHKIIEVLSNLWGSLRLSAPEIWG